MGMVAAALVFREGIHSDYGLAYIVLALAINFGVFAGVTYLFLNGFRRERTQAAQPSSDRPIQGILYTESEIEDFKRRGLM